MIQNTQAIELRGIAKSFGTHVAVEDVHFEVAEREFVTLVGPSGCGKSTLLNITAGLERPNRGRIFFGGWDVTDVAPAQRDVAMVFQSYALYPHLSVRENLAFPLKIRRRSRASIRKRVAEIAQLLEIEALLDKKPRQLSGGQRQRVAIGRAIIRAPGVCLLDEPLSNIDASLRARVRLELKLLFRTLGTSVVLVTHDQSEAMTMSDRIVVLNEGRVQQCGTPLEVYGKPANAFVATFIGSPQMNIFEAVIYAGHVRSGALVLPACRTTETKRAGSKLSIGIRPEDVRLEPFLHSAKVAATVTLIEHLGYGAIVHYRLADGTPLVGLTERDTCIGPGWTGELHLNLDNLHLFDAVSGATLN